MIRRSITATLVAFLTILGACATSTQDRQAEVAEKGRSVMPFDLDKTTHRFLPTENGLLEEVIADDPGDTSQITLIRQHLAAEAQRFQSGDFSDPARIHGHDMPGLANLTAGASKITISYADLPAGASLSFRTTEPTLVQALHDWGQAQVSDHGTHADQGNG